MIAIGGGDEWENTWNTNTGQYNSEIEVLRGTEWTEHPDSNFSPILPCEDERPGWPGYEYPGYVYGFSAVPVDTSLFLFGTVQLIIPSFQELSKCFFRLS